MHIRISTSGTVLFRHLVEIAGCIEQGEIWPSGAAAVDINGGGLFWEDCRAEYQKDNQRSEGDVVC